MLCLVLLSFHLTISLMLAAGGWGPGLPLLSSPLASWARNLRDDCQEEKCFLQKMLQEYYLQYSNIAF